MLQAAPDGGCTAPSGVGAVSGVVAAALHFFAASQCLLQENWPPHAHLDNGSHFDFIVVGAGTAGSTLAARLAAIRDVTVLLIEAGGDPPQEAIIPGFHDTLKSSAYDWNFTTTNNKAISQALKDGVKKDPRGKMLGGCGSLNDMVYSRGFPADYEEWNTLVNEDWSWETVLKYFKKTEKLTDEVILSDPDLAMFHGRSGEIEVAGSLEVSATTDKLLAAFHELGFDIVKDMTNPYIPGAGRFSHTINNGRRQSSATALLNKSASKFTNNLFVLKNTLAVKVEIEGDKAIGIKVLSNGDEIIYYANKEVIITAGTFNTPKLLQLSGIGPRKLLEDLGISVVQDLPVGENYHDHVMVLNYLSANNGTCNHYQGAEYIEMVKYLYDQSGTFANSDTMGVYFSVSSGSPAPYPDFAIYPTCITKGSMEAQSCTEILGFKSSICNILIGENKKNELISLAVVLLKPKSRGSVRIKSIDPLQEPLIYAGIFSNDEDYEGFPHAIRVARSLADTGYFRQLGAYSVDLRLEECGHGLKTETLACYARALARSAWHAAGTVALGTVLDGRLRVHGVRGLRVADASVMPRVVRGNTNAPVVMIAERAADFIKEDYAYR